jgi:hypothetical protein
VKLTPMSDKELLMSLLERSRRPWVEGDIDGIISRTIGAGFGYRSQTARLPGSERSGGHERLIAWYDSLDYIRLIPGETAVLVDGDVAVVYGSFTEEFRHKGREPKKVRVRFSNTATKRDGEWIFIWAHRDATPFDEEGRYQPPSEQEPALDRLNGP